MSASLRKAEVRNISESRAMQKSLEQSYKQHQHVIKSIEKEQTQLLQRSKQRKVIIPTNNQQQRSSLICDVIKNNDDKATAGQEVHNKSPLKSSATFPFMKKSNSTNQLLPNACFNNEELSSNVRHYLVSPKVLRKRFTSDNIKLSCSLCSINGLGSMSRQQLQDLLLPPSKEQNLTKEANPKFSISGEEQNNNNMRKSMELPHLQRIRSYSQNCLVYAALCNSGYDTKRDDVLNNSIENLRNLKKHHSADEVCSHHLPPLSTPLDNTDK
eukprot:gene16233-17871_t